MKKTITEKQLLENLYDYSFYRDYIIPKKLITKHKDKVNWFYISIYQKLSEQFIIKYKDLVDWSYISKYQVLSEKFITKYKDLVDWDNISIYQKLSERFIIKHKDKVYWECISCYQKLSEKFIIKHKNKVYWYWISKYQVLSEKFREEHKLTIPETCWLYKDKQFKLDYLKKHTNYEIVDKEYILAYKTVRKDNCSVYSPNKYNYKIAETYKSNCDYNIDNNNSFGLAAWTKEKALNYYSEGKLLLVKIMIDDIGAIVQNDQKIRCSKLTVVKEIS